MILAYQGENDFPLLKSFIRKFLEPCGFNLGWIKNPVVTREEEHIDVL